MPKLCEETTKKGLPCKKFAKQGYNVCTWHLKMISTKTYVKPKETMKTTTTITNMERKRRNSSTPLTKENEKKDNIITSPIMIGKMIYEQLIEHMDKWFHLIKPKKYRFPYWIIDLFKQDKNQFRDLCSKVQIYVNRDQVTDLKLIVQLAKQREPVNIARQQFFDKTLLKRYFGWTIGFYDEYYQKTKILPPNIAIFTPSLFLLTKYNEKDKQPDIVNQSFIKMNILHVIGFAMDHEEQSDYQFYQNRVTEDYRQIFLTNFYYNVFKLIFACSRQKELRTIILPPFGLGNFATLYDDDNLLDIWIDALVKALNWKRGRMFPFRFQFMGFHPSHSKKVKDRLLEIAYTSFNDDIGYFPGCLKQIKNLENVLFINAWDHLSAPGNGCFGDGSLDGAVGSFTTSAIVGNGALNPYMGEKCIQFVS